MCYKYDIFIANIASHYHIFNMDICKYVTFDESYGCKTYFENLTYSSKCIAYIIVLQSVNRGVQ